MKTRVTGLNTYGHNDKQSGKLKGQRTHHFLKDGLVSVIRSFYYKYDVLYATPRDLLKLLYCYFPISFRE
jgi:hypothetical protein